MDENSGSDGTAVRLDAFEFHLDPMSRVPAQVIAQQRGRLIQIDDEDIHISVVVEVSKSASAAAVGRGNARPGLLNQFFKNATAQISERRRAVFCWDIAGGCVPPAGKHGR